MACKGIQEISKRRNFALMNLSYKRAMNTLSKGKSLVIDAAGPQHKATLVWLPGVGDKSSNFRHIFNLLSLKGVRLVVPQPPTLPVSAFAERTMPAWFDLPQKISRAHNPLQLEEDRLGILLSAKTVSELLVDEAKLVPSNCIVLGGASLGGALAVHAGFRHQSQLAGIVSIAGYVPLLNEYPKFLKLPNRSTPLFALHGFEDEFIPVEFARLSYSLLKRHEVSIEYSEDREMDHRIGDKALLHLKSWLDQKLP